MKVRWCLSLLISILVQNGCVSRNCTIQDFPYMVYIVELGDVKGDLEYQSDQASGVLLSPRWILSAGTKNLANTSNLVVQFGSTNSYTERKDRLYRKVTRIVPFIGAVLNVPKSKKKFQNTKLHDISLIKIGRPIKLKGGKKYPPLRAVKLPPNEEFTGNCKKVNLTGWRPQKEDTVIEGEEPHLEYFNGTSTGCKGPRKLRIYPSMDGFCFGKQPWKALGMGSALICEGEVVIGLISPKAPVEVGSFMSWIGKTAKIKVGFQNAPETTKAVPSLGRLERITSQVLLSVMVLVIRMLV